MKTIVIILTFLALAASILWLFSNPGFEPLITSLGLLAAIGGFFVSESRQASRNEKIRALCNELRENYNVAKAGHPWSTYSVRTRGVVEEIKSDISEDVYQGLVELYLNLETANTKIKGVARGWWSDEQKTAYYGAFVSRIDSIMDSLKKNRKFKKFL